MNSIRKNFLYNAAYQILLIIMPLITTPYISRVLGADKIGIYTYSYTIANYFMLFSMLGVKNYGNRSSAVVRDDQQQLSKTFWEIYGLQAICSIIALFAYLTFILLFQTDYKIIFFIQSLYLLSGLLDISWLFFGLEQFRITVLRNIAIRLASLACIFLFVRDSDDLWKYTLIMALSVLLSQSYLWHFLRRFVIWIPPTGSSIFKHFKAELILFIPVIAVSLYTMMDKVMLRLLSSYSAVGYYESAAKVINIPLGIITALGTVMLPRMSNMVSKNQQKESMQYIHNSLLFAMFLAAGMAFGITGIAESFVPVFYGAGYEPCVAVLQVLAPSTLFIAWANVIRTQYLIPHRMDKSYCISVILGAIVNLIANSCLIPSSGALGAGIGTILAEGTVCGIQTFLVRRRLEIKHYLKDSTPFLLAGGGMTLLLITLGQFLSDTSPFFLLVLQLVAGGSLYVLCSAIYVWFSHRHLLAALIHPKHNKF